MYTGNDKISAMLSHIFLYKMFIERYIDSFGIQFWYISTLFQFYLTYYIIMKLKEKCKNNKKFLFITCMISFLYSTLVSLLNLTQYRIASSFFLQYLWEFSLGIVIADKYLLNKNITIKHKSLFPIYTIVSIIIYGILALKGGWYKNYNDVFSLISFLGIAYALYKIKYIRKLCIYFSKISYEIYLLHYLIFKTIFLYDKYLPNYILCFISIIVTIIISILYKKVLKMKGRIISEKNNDSIWNKTRSNKNVSISK